MKSSCLARSSTPRGNTSALGDALAGEGKFGEAEPLLLNGYANLKDNPQAPDLPKRQALQRIVKLYEAWGKLDKAAEHRAKLERSTNPDRGESENETEK